VEQFSRFTSFYRFEIRACKSLGIVDQMHAQCGCSLGT